MKNDQKHVRLSVGLHGLVMSRIESNIRQQKEQKNSNELIK